MPLDFSLFAIKGDIQSMTRSDGKALVFRHVIIKISGVFSPLKKGIDSPSFSVLRVCFISLQGFLGNRQSAARVFCTRGKLS